MSLLWADMGIVGSTGTETISIFQKIEIFFSWFKPWLCLPLFTFVYLCLPLFKWHIYAQIFCLFYSFQLAGEVKHLVENSTNFPSFINPSLTLLFLPSKVVFHQRSSSIKGVIYQRLCLSSKAVFHQRVSSINGHLLSKVAFYQRLSSIKGCLPSKVVFHQRLSFINKHLSSKVV